MGVWSPFYFPARVSLEHKSKMTDDFSGIIWTEIKTMDAFTEWNLGFQIP